MQTQPTDGNQTFLIIPSQVEFCISGVSRVEIAPDKTVSMLYHDHSRISTRMGPLSHALQSNFLALVRAVQNVARANGQKLSAVRIA
jgi:hypothetical protein